MELREPVEETLGQLGDAILVQLPGADGQRMPSRASAAQRSIMGAGTLVHVEHSALPDHGEEPAHETNPAHIEHESEQGAGGQKAGLPSNSGTECGMSAATMSPGRDPGPPLCSRQGSPVLSFAALIPQSSPLHAHIAAQQARPFPHSQHQASMLGLSCIVRQQPLP